MKTISKAALLIILNGAFGLAANNKLAPELQNVEASGQLDLIVQYKVQPQARQYARVAQLGGRLKRTLEVVHSATYAMPAAGLQELSNDPDVDYISPDRRVRGLRAQAESNVSANIATSYGWDGTGITVALIDSGIRDTHPDLQDSSGRSRVVFAQTFSDCGKDDRDESGHGTQVAGILGGNGAMSTGPGYTRTFTGIAPGVEFVSLKVLDRNGAGSDSQVIAAIQQAIALQRTYHIRIINLSLGRPVMESYQLDPLCRAVEQAWQAGIVVVVAAGNDGRNNDAATDGYATINSPGNDPYVITVGAMKDNGQMASYSSKGPTLFDHIVKPDLVAPGNRIISAMPTNGLYLPDTYPANKVPDNFYIAGGSGKGSSYYFNLSGTSMATPGVSGSVALLLQQTPSLTPDQVKARLMESADRNFPVYGTAIDPATGLTYTTQYDIFTIGAGSLDIVAALNNTDTLPPGITALSPTASYSSLTRTVTIAAGWEGGLGLATLFGTHTLLANTVVWGDCMVWGDPTAAGFSALWGNSVVWGGTTSPGETSAITISGEE